MIVIREQQRHVLGEPMRDDFRVRMVEHLARHFPRTVRTLSDRRLRRLIAHGIERAAGHGLHAEVCVCKYILLMFTFGADFDQGELRELVDQHLHPPRERPEFFRIDDLVEAALELTETELDLDDDRHKTLLTETFVG